MTTTVHRAPAGSGDVHEPVPHRAAERIARLRAAVAPAAGPARGFDPADVAGLPRAARRWLTHAIAPGTPLAPTAELRFEGELKLGRRWHAVQVTQVLAPTAGFVWVARTCVSHLPMSGYDAYVAGTAEMHWRLAGVPVIRRSDGDVTLSAADRLAAEAVLLPTSLVHARWRPGDGPDAATYAQHVVGRFSRSWVTIDVAPDGRLAGVRMQRWGNPAGGSYGLHRFAVRFDAEYHADGLTVPDALHASWVPATGGDRGAGEFFRARLLDVRLDRVPEALGAGA